MSNRWIKCGLPWTYHDFTVAWPAPPNLDKQVKKIFGQTIAEAYNVLRNLGYDKDAQGIDELENDADYKAAGRKYRRFAKKVEEWQKDQPEFKAYRAEQQRLDEEYNQKSFCGRKLNKPGTLVEILAGKELKQFLIGDINSLGGVCDDCLGFAKESVVVRYKVLNGR